MEKLPPLAWAAIAIILVVGAVVNIWMVALLRSKDLRKLSAISDKRPPRGISMENMQKFVKVLRDPFGDQKQDLDQLSKLVQELKDQDDPHQKRE